MGILENIKAYFKNTPDASTVSAAAPKGVCPNCWGKQEWDGHFYEQMRAVNITPKDDAYNNFIKEFVRKNIDGITIKKDTYTCTTCNITYDKSILE